jgi:hypothetical protein
MELKLGISNDVDKPILKLELDDMSPSDWNPNRKLSFARRLEFQADFLTYPSGTSLESSNAAKDPKHVYLLISESSVVSKNRLDAPNFERILASRSRKVSMLRDLVLSNQPK